MNIFVDQSDVKRPNLGVIRSGFCEFATTYGIFILETKDNATRNTKNPHFAQKSLRIYTEVDATGLGTHKSRCNQFGDFRSFS